ncbi:MAG: hypothetical protein ACE5FT_07360, partial [Candidatus Nanoarchaeia archaeon]
IPFRSTPQYLAVGQNLVRVETTQGGAIAAPVGGPIDPLLYTYIGDYASGLFFSPWDIIKGIVLGVITKGAEKAMDVKYNRKGKYTKALRNGFIVGGVAGGFEGIVDNVAFLINGRAIEIRDITHEAFQGILIQGLIAGLTNVALTWSGV